MFLSECIKSILTQKYTNFELIIIDDFSPDRLETTINQFRDDRIRYYRNSQNIGGKNVINNWNKCLEKASGEFFILMGDDDMMEPDYLEEFEKLIKKYPDLNVYHCRSQIINEKSETITFTPSWPEFETLYDNIWHRINNGKRDQFISDFVYRTKFLKMNGGFVNLPLAWGADDITAYVACGTKGIAHTNKPIFKYRKNSLSITSTGNPEMKMRAIDLEQKWFEDFLLKQPECNYDYILYKDINRKVHQHIRRKKLQVISLSLKSDFWKNAGRWIYSSRKYNISVVNILYAMLIRVVHDSNLLRNHT
ncbi:glycosyltransferase family 2 protein [Pontibacter sp. KCTC 32443]|nr:glycosyltransferase family 2 protein [Pontibacter sp. KCTC 32443]